MAQTLELRVIDGDAALLEPLQTASATRSALAQDAPLSSDILVAARSDYARLLGVLYENGYYGGQVTIRLDGRPLQSVSPFAPPAQIGVIAIDVATGPQFRFGQTRLAPQAPGTLLPDGFAIGAPARSATVRTAARQAVEAWQANGHALAQIGAQDIVADHRDQTLDVALRVDPGPQLRFGALRVDGTARTDPDRVRQIAGVPMGDTFSPADLQTAAERLRGTGAFSSVALALDDTANPDGSIDVLTTLVEAPLRRIGFGAEVATDEGLAVSGFWLHRNLFGGAERLRFDASIGDIGATRSGLDYLLSAEFRRPGTFAPGTDLILATTLQREDTPSAISDRLMASATLQRALSPDLTGALGIAYMLEEMDRRPGRTAFRILSFPAQLGFDTRDDVLGPTDGALAQWDLTPYLGQLDAQNGVRSYVDLRGFRAIGDRLVLAARAQWGAVFGSGLTSTPSEFLFLSGGAGTVRGQDFESLGTTASGAFTGGRSLLAGSLEARLTISDRIGVVGFYDYGFVGANSLPDQTGTSHAGYGGGIRYTTPIGAIRFDVGFPVGGDLSPRLYLGIGQAF